MAEPKASDLDRRISFQAKGVARDPDLNTPVEGDWKTIAGGSVWAEIQDVLPIRSAEAAGGGISIERRPARVRVRYRRDIDSAMRIVVWLGDEGRGEIDRVLQIIAGPAEIYGRRRWIEMLTEEYSSAEGVA